MPLVFIEMFFLHMWHQTMCGLWRGSAGPDIKDLVHPILEKNSSRMGTPRRGTLFVLADLAVEPLCRDFRPGDWSRISDRVTSRLFLSTASAPSAEESCGSPHCRPEEVS